MTFFQSCRGTSHRINLDAHLNTFANATSCQSRTMKLNQDTVITFRKPPTFYHRSQSVQNDNDSLQLRQPPPLAFVPYNEVHVPTYHEWMQRTDLLELTASERLDLQTEYKSMREWREDENKLTFILVDTSIAPNYIIGDVNVCLLNEDEDEDEDEDNGKMEAEIDVMIAEIHSRRKGFAQIAVFTAMAYLKFYVNNNINTFVAKIIDTNQPSVRLFTEKIGFVHHRYVKAFQEVHLKKFIDKEFEKVLQNVSESWTMSKFKGSVFQTRCVDNQNKDLHHTIQNYANLT